MPCIIAIVAEAVPLLIWHGCLRHDPAPQQGVPSDQAVQHDALQLQLSCHGPCTPGGRSAELLLTPGGRGAARLPHPRVAGKSHDSQSHMQVCLPEEPCLHTRAATCSSPYTHSQLMVPPCTCAAGKRLENAVTAKPPPWSYWLCWNCPCLCHNKVLCTHVGSFLPRCSPSQTLPAQLKHCCAPSLSLPGILAFGRQSSSMQPCITAPPAEPPLIVLVLPRPLRLHLLIIRWAHRLPRRKWRHMVPARRQRCLLPCCPPQPVSSWMRPTCVATDGGTMLAATLRHGSKQHSES